MTAAPAEGVLIVPLWNWNNAYDQKKEQEAEF